MTNGQGVPLIARVLADLARFKIPPSPRFSLTLDVVKSALDYQVSPTPATHSTATSIAQPGGVLQGDEGVARVEALMRFFGQELEIDARGLDGLAAFRAIRRTAPAYELGMLAGADGTWPWGISQDRWFPLRRPAELALIRWGQWTVNGDPRTRPFPVDHLMSPALGRLLVHSSSLRRLGKVARFYLSCGATIEITSVIPFLFRTLDDDSGFGEAIRHYFIRSSFENIAGFLGQALPRATAPAEAPVWLQDFHAVDLKTYAGNAQNLDPVLLDLYGDMDCPAFLPQALHEHRDIPDAYAPFETAFYQAYSCSSQHVLIAMALLLQLSVESFTSALPGSSTGDYLRHLTKVGYWIIPTSEIESLNSASINRLPAWLREQSIETSELRNAVGLLRAERNQLNPSTGGPHAVLYPFDDWSILDVAHLAETLRTLLLSTIPAVTSKRASEPLERQVHDLLKSFGSQPWPSGVPVTKKDRSGPGTDIDASVIVNRVLIAIDCYTMPWDLRTFEGDFPRLRSRSHNCVDKLSQWDARMSALARGELVLPNSTLMQSGVEAILPLVVTGAPEYIGDLHSEIWIMPDTPRILTIQEVRILIRSADLITLPGVIAVPR